MRSNIAGSIDVPLSELIDRKLMRFMGETAAYSFLSAEEAIKDANLKQEDFDSRLGIITGSGGASGQVEAADISREKGVKELGYRVTQTGKYSFSMSCNFSWNQGYKLFYIICMLY